jgi:MFS family permease
MNPQKRLPKNVILLGLVSFFNDLASEMVYPLVPILLTTVLGAPVALVGLIEGIAESTASLLKVVFGRLSDKARRRKIFAVYGYSLSTISKLIIGTATAWPMVLSGRFLDRFGKGIRTSARDALIAESADSDQVGKAFGLHRAMDTAGAVLGPLLAIQLMQSFGNENLRLVFYVALIPGTIGVLLLIFMVREKPPGSVGHPLKFKFSGFSPAYRTFLIVSAVFALGNSSDAFLILRAKSLGLSNTQTVLTYVVFNLVYAMLSYGAGSMSDKVGPRRLLTGGFFLFTLIYLLFGINTSTVWIWLLFGLYGVYMALTEGISKAYITQISYKAHLATSFGAYQTLIGICTFFSSLIAGLLWTRFGPSVPFIFGAVMALIAGILFMFYGHDPIKANQTPSS